MSDLVQYWFYFGLCAAAIALAGPVLAQAGENISEISGLSQSWVGLVMLAVATSLPELVTGLSAVTIADAPDIAVGDALGSCVFNLMLLVLLDVMSPSEPLYRRLDQGHSLAAAFGIILIGLVASFILLGHAGFNLRILHIGLATPAIIALYLLAMRSLFLHQRATAQPGGKATRRLAGPLLRYTGAALVILLAGSWLPLLGVKIAALMGWEQSFMGTIFIAAATSLPEFFVTLAALRIGAVDMAVGNLLGSNLFDVLVLAFDDMAYRPGPLLGAASIVHVGTGIAAMTMSALFIVALVFRSGGRLVGNMGWISLFLVILFLASSWGHSLPVP